MSDFYQVAEHLSSHAKKCHDDAADAFGRTALNRYYYATYLSVREFLGQMDKSWEGQSHSEIPTLLEGKLLKRIKDAAKNQERSGLLTKPKSKSFIASASSATSLIASILKSAYSIRVISDYKPNEKLVFSKDGFSFGDHTDLEARNWRNRVEIQKGILLNISRELGVVS
ncbi:hypothetical protein NUF47_003397 [Yersinia enterocolitica]|uniref:hypothetical protein n=1 Tax=Yersinia intermedia TaxID=631 RepID=UPI0005AC1391|nr:hypothetical protein [Yersinia intermedia]AJJ18879.1 hypothetical protein CH53_1840 [Yersinia intermedia]EKN4195707.1 hypothetical protein [Yersinia enterocolitica]EKN6131565.1 hypothetical protein [Yersinia enterocolitica]